MEKVTLIASGITAPVPWPFLQNLVDLDVLEVGCFHDFNFSTECSDIDLVPDGAPDSVIDWADILAVAADSTLNPYGIIPVFDCDELTVPIGVPILTDVPGNCENSSLYGDRAPVGTLGLPDREPLMILREGAGLPPQERPVTSTDIFGGFTRATFQMVAFTPDTFIGAPEQLEALFAHLTTGENSAFTVIGGPNASHAMFIFYPEEFLDGLVEGGICLIPPSAISTPIPTLSKWGLVALAGILGIVGFMVIRRSKVTA